jgi:sugar/nucleoside kinase (ribokinase family)
MDLIQPLTRRAAASPCIVAIGQASIDLVLIDGKPPSVEIGGSAYIPARIWAESGIRVGLVCCLGEDLPASELQTENLDLRGVMTVTGPSTLVELRYSDQKLVGLRVAPGASERLGVSQIPSDYFDADLFYITPAPVRFLVELTEVASARGIALAFSPKEDFPTIEEPGMTQIFSRCKICFVNERELFFITSIASKKAAIAALHNAGPDIVVVTEGRRGVTISSRENGSFDLSPSVVVRTENPIGAGDCFAASFLASLIAGHTARDSAGRAIARTERWLINRKQSYHREVGL